MRKRLKSLEQSELERLLHNFAAGCGNKNAANSPSALTAAQREMDVAVEELAAALLKR